MKAEAVELENIVIRRAEDRVTVAKRREHVVDGIVTGTIVDLVALPLLLAAAALGVWMIVLGIRESDSLLLVPVGLVFVVLSAAPLYLLWWSQAAFFPYECRFRRNGDGKWLVQRRLGFLGSRWRVLDTFAVVARPTSSRGAWGYDLIVKAGRSRIMVTPPGVFTASKAEARRAAERACKAVAELLGAENRLEQWG